METRKLSEFGERVRCQLDLEPGTAADLQTARAQLLRRVSSQNAPRRSGLGAPRLALMATCLAAFIPLVWWFTRPLSFEVGADKRVRLGDLVFAVGREPLAVNFTDGSTILMSQGSRLRVLDTERNGARVLIENGSLDVHVKHEQDTGWRFDLGVFQVHVRGTAFRLDYEPASARLEVVTREGEVTVTAPCLDGERAVRAGATFEFACRHGVAKSLAPSNTEANEPTPRAPEPVLEAPTAAPSALGAPAPVKKVPHSPDPVGDESPADWRALLSKGERAQAVAAAQSAGFERACREASLNQLVQLADAARLEGRITLAVQALGSLRQRFAGTAEAGTAAFTLGRIAFDQQGAYAQAAQWFQTYVQEVPGGALMGDAVGRLMEARQRSGDRAGARRDARNYLGRFPSGPYASKAKAILAE